ncbi:MAG: tol-pal system protein YbgF [Alphaproteobacteria bacterium]|nr:tol-pal system protein YbgF [Alphaproteobacteria bacterium]
MIQRVAVPVLALCFFCGPASAQLFGPSDEEKAREAFQTDGVRALQGTSQQQDARIKTLEDKVQGLTQSLTQATGTNEELSHQLQIQNDKIDKMQKDFAYRLCTLSAQQLGAGDSINCAAAGTASAVAPQPYSQMRPGDALPPIGSTTIDASGINAAPDVPPANLPPANLRGRPPGTLGTLPAAPSAVPPVPTSSAQYDQAMNLMGRAQYDEAAAAFRAYADANPGDTELAPQAIYWVANISFIHQDYAPAARTFAEVIKKYPKSSRAPDAMLKLAQSFMGMGQKSEGCTTLGLIKTKYPNASPQTLGQAASLRKTACSK